MRSNTSSFLILHNIRSVRNVGSIFRTADAAGVEKIYLTGYTPQPFDRFGRKRKDFTKTALGAEDMVLWKHCASITTLIKKLRQEKVTLVAVEQDAKAVDYRTLNIKGPTAFLFGNEVKGTSPQLRTKCDVIAEIPMAGAKESLNVSVAAGVFLFRVLNPEFNR